MERRDETARMKLPWLEKFIFHTLLITFWVLPFSIALNEIFMGITILSWVVKIIVRREKMKVPPLGYFFLIFLLVSIVSAMASDYRMEALRGVWDITRYTITFFIIFDIVRSTGQVKRVLWTLGLSTGVWAVAGMIHQFLIAKRRLFELLQFFSLGNKNAIGQYLQMVLSILFGLLLNHSFRAREKAVWITLSLVSLFALFLSGAKTMWLAFIITLFVFAFLKRSYKVMLGAGGFILFIIAAALIIGPVRDMSFNILKLTEAPSMQIRLMGWKQCYHMFIDNFFLGVGPKCFMLARDQYGIIRDFGQAHNIVLQVACEMGIVGVAGLFSWIAFYAYFIATYRKKVSSSIYRGLWYGGVGYIITLVIGGITEPTIGGEHSQLFMALAGLLQVGIKCNGNDSQGRKMREETL